MLYDITGKEIVLNTPNKIRDMVRGISHRGYNVTAPENTIPAYILAKKMGYKYAECDVAFTSDNVAVLLHDATIDRTSNGTGNIFDMTYEEALQYDFGSWKSATYAGTKIPTFEEFIRVCKEIGIHPYIELKSDGNYTREQVTSIVEMVKAAGMQGNVTYCSFSASYLGYVHEVDANARLGLCALDATAESIAAIMALKGNNDVYITIRYTNMTDEKAALCMAAGLTLEVWCPNEESWIQSMNPYITGVASDSLVAEKVLYSKHISEGE